MTHQTTTTVTKQVTSHGGKTVVTTGNREWSSGLCACTQDCKMCCFAGFCTFCYGALLSNRLGECCCTMWCAGIHPMRTKLRIMLGIQGSVFKDCLASTFCPFCTLCQMGRELDASGWPK